MSFLTTTFTIKSMFSISSIRTKLSSGEMTVSGDQWPMMVYADQEYDHEDPWAGLFRSRLLVWVAIIFSDVRIHLNNVLSAGVQTYLHFT